jgi:signal transduction histidine kinase
MLKWNRIDLKLGMMIFSLFMVILIILGIVINGIITNFYTKEAHEEANDIATHVSLMLQDNSDSMIDISTMAEFTGVELFLVDANGLFVESSYKNSSNITEKFPDIWQKSELLEGVMIQKEFTSGNTLYLLHGKPLMDVTHTLTGGVYVVSSLESMKDSIRSVRLLLLFAGIGALVLALGLIYILSKKLSRPLLQIEAATRKIAKGELHTRVPVTSDDEIGSLSTAINDLAQELQRYRDSRSEFFANISHELRTPITYLEGYADVLSKGFVENEEEKRKYLTIISQESRRLNIIIQDLFDLSKMEEGRIDLNLEMIDLKLLLENSIHKVELQAKEKGLVIIAHLENTRSVLLDRARMEQVILNLLDNGIRYTLHGSLTITLHQQGKNRIITIEDSGPGIPEDELPYIFERFYRVEKSRSRKYGGTGLGLSIVQKLVELQGGSIEVKSTEGKGSVFIISFEDTSI